MEAGQKAGKGESMTTETPARPRSGASLIDAIVRECKYQNRKYGTPTVRKLTVTNYLDIARQELDEAMTSAADGDQENALRELLQVVTVGVQCLMVHGIVER